ncbi:hypothetical protein BS47DRAFT_360205 [Hydnum rufescens UP504]|uniref:Uncharacterized protein n=1 Tax=Hydnum rufescens UP504 TaxID=1448309 RepID=A0A9P6DQ46_9AGAM|nr:hypothetical protein BS47DRAFT_360205 [Hydnum rufescens UP504]
MIFWVASFSVPFKSIHLGKKITSTTSSVNWDLSLGVLGTVSKFPTFWHAQCLEQDIVLLRTPRFREIPIHFEDSNVLMRNNAGRHPSPGSLLGLTYRLAPRRFGICSDLCSLRSPLTYLRGEDIIHRHVISPCWPIYPVSAASLPVPPTRRSLLSHQLSTSAHRSISLISLPYDAAADTDMHPATSFNLRPGNEPQ